MHALLERLDAGYLVVAVLLALLPFSRFRSLGAVGLCLLALAAAAERVAASPNAEGFHRFNGLLALAGLGLTLTAIGLGIKRREPEPCSGVPGATRPDPLLWLGLALVAFASHLLLFALGLGLGIAVALRAGLRARRPLWLIPLVLATLVLGLGLVLLFTILGSESARLTRLSEGPFSPAAERLLVLLLGSGAMLLALVPPRGRAPWGLGLAPFAVLLLIRVSVPAFPLGLLAWQAPAMALLAVSLAAAAYSAEWLQTAVLGGLLAAWSGAGSSAAIVLVFWAWLVETGTALLSRRSVRLRPRWSAAVALPAALAGLPALTAGLRAQVLLSMVALAGCAAGFGRAWWRGARNFGTPLY